MRGDRQADFVEKSPDALSRYLADAQNDSIILNNGRAGKSVMESVVETGAATILDFLRGLRGRVEVTFEEGTHAAWLYDVLQKTKATVIVCDPRRNRLLQDGNKSDRVDARKLARLLRAGLLSPVYHGGHGTRDLKELVRSYEYLVEDSTRTMNRIKALYRSRAIACSGTDVYKPRQREGWLAKLPGPGARARAERLYSELDHLTGLRREARKALVAECRRHPAAKVLLGVPTLGGGARRATHRGGRHPAPLPE